MTERIDAAVSATVATRADLARRIFRGEGTGRAALAHLLALDALVLELVAEVRGVDLDASEAVG